jgi:hypothetical protein
VLLSFGSILARFVWLLISTRSDAERVFVSRCRCPFSVVSTCGRLRRRWDNVLVLRSVGSAQKLVRFCIMGYVFQAVICVTGMYALRERRQHVTQEDFEFAVAKVCVELYRPLQ